MSRNIWIGIVVIIVLVVGGWWYFKQSSVPMASETKQLPTEQVAQQNTNSGTQILKVLFLYSILYSENFNSARIGFPVILDLENGPIQGTNFALLRSGSDTFYTALGIDTKKPSGDWCTGVSVVIEVTNPKLESNKSLMGGQKALAVDLVRIVSHDEPRQVCAP